MFDYIKAVCEKENKAYSIFNQEHEINDFITKG